MASLDRAGGSAFFGVLPSDSRGTVGCRRAAYGRIAGALMGVGTAGRLCATVAFDGRLGQGIMHDPDVLAETVAASP